VRQRKRVFRLSSLVIALLTIIILAIGLVGAVHAQSAPAIQTDKTKYSLGDTMIISGVGFTAGGAVNIEVLRPDHEIDSLPSVTADGAGSFQTTYTPPIIPGRYKITATDGTNIARTAATDADVGNMQLVAYNVDVNNAGNLVSVSWGRGNSAKGWIEGAWYPIILKIPNAQVEYGTNLTNLPDMYIAFDFYNAAGAKQGVYADLVRSIQIGVTDLNDGAHDSWGWPQANGTPYPSANLVQVRVAQTAAGENAWTGFTLAKTVGLNAQTQVNFPVTANPSELGTPPGTTTADKHQFMVTGNQIRAALSAQGNLGTNMIVIYFQLHLARTFVWSHHLESQYATNPTTASYGGWLYGYSIWNNYSTGGSSQYPGSSAQAYLNTAGEGKKTCQMPIPPEPGGVINGLKWHDFNGNHVMDGNETQLSGWTIYISGIDPEGILFSVGVLTGDTDGDGIVNNVSSGAYSFADLTPATWYITENTDRDVPPSTGWFQTFPYMVVSVPPVAQSGLVSGFPSEAHPADVADWGWVVNLTETNMVQSGLNFGNRNVGCLEITKELSIPGGVPLGPLDGTFIIHVAGPNAFSQNISFTMVNGVITSQNPVTLNDLMPGNYTLTEPGIPSYWTPSGLGTVVVNSGEICATTAVTNTFQTGCLEIVKSVDLSEVIGPIANIPDVNFIITVTGP
jgi:hypothetical protein